VVQVVCTIYRIVRQACRTSLIDLLRNLDNRHLFEPCRTVKLREQAFDMLEFSELLRVTEVLQKLNCEMSKCGIIYDNLTGCILILTLITRACECD